MSPKADYKLTQGDKKLIMMHAANSVTKDTEAETTINVTDCLASFKDKLSLIIKFTQQAVLFQPPAAFREYLIREITGNLVFSQYPWLQPQSIFHHEI